MTALDESGFRARAVLPPHGSAELVLPNGRFDVAVYRMRDGCEEKLDEFAVRIRPDDFAVVEIPPPTGPETGLPPRVQARRARLERP